MTKANKMSAEAWCHSFQVPKQKLELFVRRVNMAGTDSISYCTVERIEESEDYYEIVVRNHRRADPNWTLDFIDYLENE